jgi:hypothetical protein
MAFSGLPHALIFITIVASQTELYRSVRKRLRANQRYNVVTNPTTTTTTTTTGNNVIQSEAQKAKLQAVASQSFCYVMAFMVTLLPPTVIGYVQYFDYDHFIDARNFPLFCILYVTYPGQGALNFLVFIRPQYLMLRRKENYGRWRAFWTAATVVDMQQGGLSRHQRRSRRSSLDPHHQRHSSMMMMMNKTANTVSGTTSTDHPPPSSTKTATERDLSPSGRGASVPPGGGPNDDNHDEIEPGAHSPTVTA